MTYCLEMLLRGSIATLVIIFIMFLYKYYRNKYFLSKIPSPPGHFLLGNIQYILGGPEKMFDTMRKFSKEYWPIYKIEAFYITSINFMQPEDFEIVLSSTKHLTKSKAYLFLKQWLGDGLLTSTGEKWHSRRKILTSTFHFYMLQKYINVFYEETENLVKQLEKEVNKPHINVVPFVSQMTLQTINETAMGINNISTDTQLKYKNAVYRIGEIFNLRRTKPWYRFSFLYYFTQLKKEENSAVNTLHDFANQVISEREKKIEPKNFSYSGRKHLALLDLLIKAKNNGENIDVEGIREEVDTFMFTGHDTTSSAISFVLLSLGIYKDIQKKVVKEIEEVLGTQSDGKIPTYYDLQNLKYTERVIKESLRLHPIVPLISRIASENFVTHDGYKIPKGALLIMHIFDMHRHPSIYTDPLKFDPDRFLPENCRKRHPFAYLPFSAGPRNCIGQKFALLELKTVLCGVLRRFNLEAVDKIENLKFTVDLILRTENGIRIKFIPKLK